MIEKKVYYVWFGGQKSKKVLTCIQSWKKHLKGYKIIELNEKSIDLAKLRKKNRFFDECYKRKLWAFVSDFLRIYILYKKGGIYLDTDIELVKDLTPLLENDLFCAYEKDNVAGFSIFGCKKEHEFLAKMLKFYENKIYQSPLYVITDILNHELSNYKKNDITIYKSEYFYPFCYDEDFTYLCVKPQTYAIHWWGKSWVNNPNVYYLKYKHLPFVLRNIKLFLKYLEFYVKKILHEQ